MATLGEARVNIRANLAPLKRGLLAAKGMVSSAIRKMNMRILSTMKSGLTRLLATVRRIARLIGLALIAAFAFAVKSAIEFNDQMAMINTMLDDKTEPLLEGFAINLRILSKEFGQTTATLSKGLFDILSASISAEKAMKLLEATSRAAVAGGTDVATVTNAVVGLINAYGMEAEDAIKITDQMFGAFKKGVFTFEEIASSIGNVASTASIAGLSLEELLAILATITRGGIKMNEAVTSVNGVLRAFIKPTDEGKIAAEKYGLELSTATLRTLGFVGAIQKLSQASAEDLAIITPRIRGLKAIARAVSDITGLTRDYAFITGEAAGLTERSFAKMSATVGFKFRTLGKTIVDAGREMGLTLEGPVGEAVERLRAWFGRLQDTIARNRDAIEEFGFKALDAFRKVAAAIKFLAGAADLEDFIERLKFVFRKIIDAIKAGFEKHKPELVAAAVTIGEAIGEGIVAGVGAVIKSKSPLLRAFVFGPFDPLNAMQGASVGAGAGAARKVGDL